MWFTQNRIYVAGMFFRHFKSNLTSLRIRCWGSLHMSHLCASPCFFRIDDKGFWVDPCEEQKYIKRHSKHRLGVQIEQVGLYCGVIDLRCAGEGRSTSRGTK